MNRFSKIESKTAFINALIEHLQRLKNNRYQLSHIEKDILLQDLRDAYLLLLSFQPADELGIDLEMEEFSSPIGNMMRVASTMADEKDFLGEPSKPLTNEEIENNVKGFLDNVECLKNEEDVSDVITEEPEITLENMDPDAMEEELGMNENTAEKTLVEETIKQETLIPEKKTSFREPLLFSNDDFTPKGLFDDVEEEVIVNNIQEEVQEEIQTSQKELTEEVVDTPNETLVEKIIVIEEVVEKKTSVTEVISKLEAESDISELVKSTDEEKKDKQPIVKKSLNDMLIEQREDKSLNTRFQNAKVTDLTKSISINDKFLFIRELFSNRGEEFSKAVQALNNCCDIEEAFEHIDSLKKEYMWDSASSAYLSFCDLVRKKF
jgi:hypothetical protein